MNKHLLDLTMEVSSINTYEKYTTGGAYIIVNDEWLSVNISKCACTYLKRIACANHNIHISGHPIRLLIPMKNRVMYAGNPIYYVWNKEIQAAIENIDNFKKFAVYRDPVERLISTYNDKVLGDHWPTYNLIGIGKHTSIDEFLNYVESELNKKPEYNGINIEEHIRPQYLFYNHDDVDIVVNNHKLERFLLKNKITDTKNILNSYFKHKIPYKFDKNEMYDKIKDRVRNMYLNDYKIPLQFKTY